MVTHLLLLILAVSTQTDAIFTDTVPADVPTFEVIVGSSGTPFHAALKVNGQWVTDHRTEINGSQTVDLVPDGPFYSGEPTRTLMRNVTLAYEAPAMRRRRLRDMWTSMGYTFVETPNGWRPVKEEDVRLAQRAHELAQAEQSARAVLQEETRLHSENAPAVSESTGLNHGVLWGGRVGIIVVVILILGALYYTGKNDDTASWKRIE